MHTPYSAGKWNPTGDVYKGMMWRSDVYVGQLVQQLHQKSMYDNTLIVYLADKQAPPAPRSPPPPHRVRCQYE